MSAPAGNLFVLSSARSQGNTLKAIEHLRDVCGVTGDVMDLSHSSLQPFSYDTTEPSQAFLDFVDRASAVTNIIFATPVYWYAMSSNLKMLFEQFNFLLTSHQHLCQKLLNKNCFLAVTGYNQELPIGFDEPVRQTVKYFQMDLLATAYFQIQEGQFSPQATSRFEELANSIKAV